MDALKRQQEMKEAQGAVSTSTAAAAASTAAPMLQAPSGSTAAQPVEGKNASKCSHLPLLHL